MPDDDRPAECHAHIAYVGVGSNLGDRAAVICRANRELAGSPGVRGVRSSLLYETAPWGVVEQPAFLNSVVRVETTLGPLQLFLLLQRVESGIGRTRTYRWGPREIDLDLLLYDDLQLTRRGLQIPHPRMHERAFVLVPLRELYPGFRSSLGEGIELMLARLAADLTNVRPYAS